MYLDKFVDFTLNIVLREILENEQVMLFKTSQSKHNASVTLSVALRNAIWTGCPMLYIYSEILIIDLTINFCELYLFAYSQKMRFRG